MILQLDIQYNMIKPKSKGPALLLWFRIVYRYKNIEQKISDLNYLLVHQKIQFKCFWFNCVILYIKNKIEFEIFHKHTNNNWKQQILKIVSNKHSFLVCIVIPEIFILLTISYGYFYRVNLFYLIHWFNISQVSCGEKEDCGMYSNWGIAHTCFINLFFCFLSYCLQSRFQTFQFIQICTSFFLYDWLTALYF